MTTSMVDSVTGGVARAHRSAWRRMSRGRLQCAHPYQVVDCRGEQKLPVHPTSAAVTELTQPADRLHPAEDFFNPFPGALADRVARMPRRARIERATVLLLRDVRRGLQRAQRVYETSGVVRFVAADGDPSLRQTRDETRGGVAFAGAGRGHDARIDDQTVPILHQHFAEIGQLGLVSLRPL